MPEPLPIDAYLPAVVTALASGRHAVVVAEPGAGKTTRLPPAVVRSGVAPGHLVMLQPRRVAARLAAARIADEQGWRLGHEVGYQVRFERVMTEATPLRIVTEGILARRLVDDPLLEGVGCVVLDEFHERSLDADLALAMLREASRTRPDLRIIVMSATLDAKAVAAYLGDAAVFDVPGRAFPVEVRYAGDDPTRPIEARAARALEALPADGDVLVFLPGVREIEATLAEVTPWCRRHGYDALPLHASLTKDEQDAAVTPPTPPTPPTRPRVICATNVAETSLTLPGVRAVIDSGLVRRASFDVGRGVETLETGRVSRASADQRAGRAGRVAAGVCVRLWSQQTHRTLAAYEAPEVRTSDVARACLSVLEWGARPHDFGWFEPPDDARLAAATLVLDKVGATADGRITGLGRALARIPLPPRLAALVALASPALRDEAVTLAALLGESAEVPGRRTASVGDLLDAFHRRRLDPIVDRAARRAAEALGRLRPDVTPARAATLDGLLFRAFPDRVCRRRSPDAATLVDGGGIRIAEPAAVRGDWFLALDVRRGGFARNQEADVRLVCDLDPAWVWDQADVEHLAFWDGTRAVARRVRRYGDLVLEDQRGGPLEPGPAAAAMIEALVPDAGRVLREALAGDQLVERLTFLREHLPPHRLPDGVPVPAPEADAAGRVGAACFAAAASGRATLAGVEQALRDAAEGDLWASGVRHLLDAETPTHVVVPTGSRVRLDWSQATHGRGPVLAVRLQELFGLADTPRVAGGVAVTLHLLAPNMRTQQTTDDLASFWANTYPQVRKDLRARYPRHSWPDDPLSAVAVRGTGRRREA